MSQWQTNIESGLAHALAKSSNLPSKKQEAFSLKMILEKGLTITGLKSNISSESSSSSTFNSRKRSRNDLELIEAKIRSKNHN